MPPHGSFHSGAAWRRAAGAGGRVLHPDSFENCGWQGSSFSMFAHYATHVDAPNHFIEGAHGIDQIPISRLMGAAALVPLDHHGAAPGTMGGIAADALEDRGRHARGAAPSSPCR